MKEKTRDFAKIGLIVLFYVIIYLALYKVLQTSLTTGFFSDLLSNVGILAPILMLFIQIGQVIIAPIPVGAVSAASGYIFGAFWGFIIAYIGLLIGSFIVFFIGKEFGRPLVRRIVSKRIMSKYDGYVQKISIFILTLIYFLPLFPDDEITYILGMSKTKTRKMVIPLFLGKIGGAGGPALIGGGIREYPQYTFHIILAVLIATILLFYYRHTLEKWFEKIINKLKKD